MKVILFFVISCLALHKSKGAPRTAVYKFVRCNPERDQANCVTQRGPEMTWSPDLPTKLPALAAQYLEAEPEEGESPPWNEEKVGEEEEDEPMMSEEGESPVVTEDGSGGYEGSAATFMADWALGETGSGESWAEKGEELYKDKDMKDMKDMRRLFPSRPVVGEAKHADPELREDQLLEIHSPTNPL